MKRLFAIGLFVGLAAVGGDSSAQSVGFHSAAAICSSTQPKNDASFGLWAAGATNVALDVNGSVTCGFPLQGGPQSIYLDYIDNHPNGAITCTPWVVSFFNGIALDWQGAAQSSSAAGTGSGYFTWTIPSGIAGYAAVTCSLPPRPSGSLGDVAKLSTIKGIEIP